MDFSNVVFSKSLTVSSKEVFFDEKNEIVFIGRSNVGKSSLMNNIFSKKDLVKTSSKPGKTRLANMFLVENKYYLVDLPGYGFAKLGKNLKTELDGLISWYLEEKKPYIKKVVLLIDSKLGAQEIDIEMYKFLLELGLEVVIVLSKIDKLSKSELIKSITHTKKSFFGQEIIPVSNKNKIGLKALIKVLKHTLLN